MTLAKVLLRNVRKCMTWFCLITFSFNYLEVRLALSFRFFLVEVVSVTFDIQTDLKMKHV